MARTIKDTLSFKLETLYAHEELASSFLTYMSNLDTGEYTKDLNEFKQKAKIYNGSKLHPKYKHSLLKSAWNAKKAFDYQDNENTRTEYVTMLELIYKFDLMEKFAEGLENEIRS